MSERSIHPYEPYLPEGATKLIIGTIPPYRFCGKSKPLYPDDVNFYYGSRDNSFWDLLSKATGVKLQKTNTQEAVDERKELLGQLHTGITDMIKSCIHKDAKSEDNALASVELKDLKALLHKYPQINTLIYTNKSSNIVGWVNHFSDKGYHEKWDKKKSKGSVTIGEKEYTVYCLYSPSPNALRGVTEDERQEQYNLIFKKE